MHGSHTSDEFLDRVRRVYRNSPLRERHSGPVWKPIDQRRDDVHDALVSDDFSQLKKIFADPSTTDLFYGVDNFCRSIRGIVGEKDFVPLVLRDERALLAEYEARRVIALLQEQNESSVVEIGPGLGRVAYHAFKAGVADYTTIDLPMGVVAQACFLGAALGPDALWFEGEDEALSVNRIKLRTIKPDRMFSVALNVDSITEMRPQDAINYVLWLERHAAVLLSINHSRNYFTVTELFSYLGVGSLQDHFPCPLWPEYLEQVYLINGVAQPPFLSTRATLLRLYIGARARARNWLAK